jgi:DNA-binding response OmpR family regulator
MLLSHGESHRDRVVLDQLPRLLEPMGIRSVVASTGEEAADIIRTVSIHVAVVDLAVPLCRFDGQDARQPSAATAPGGPRILQLLRRLDQPPPTVVVRPPQPSVRESSRTLTDALREGAFAVLDRPIHLETMLEVMRRILRRHYAGQWPNC